MPGQATLDPVLMTTAIVWDELTEDEKRRFHGAAQWPGLDLRSKPFYDKVQSLCTAPSKDDPLGLNVSLCAQTASAVNVLALEWHRKAGRIPQGEETTGPVARYSYDVITSRGALLRWDPGTDTSYPCYRCDECKVAMYGGGPFIHRDECSKTGYGENAALLGHECLNAARKWAEGGLSQVLFPRSKRRRIRRKWAKRPSNFRRDEEYRRLVPPPLIGIHFVDIVAAKEAWDSSSGVDLWSNSGHQNHETWKRKQIADHERDLSDPEGGPLPFECMVADRKVSE